MCQLSYLDNMNFRLIQKLSFSIFLTGAIAGTQFSYLTSFEEKNRHNKFYDVQNDSYALSLLSYLPNAGFGNIVSGYVFIKFLEYFGNDEERANTGYALSHKFFEPIIRNDPYYRDYYLFLSASTTTHAGMPEETVSLMSDGLRFFGSKRPPEGYYVWRYKAVDELLFLGDRKSAQDSFKIAAQWGQESSDSNAIRMAQLSQQTAQFLAENPDSIQAEIDAWSSVLTTALNSETRQRAIARIRDLGGSVFISDDGSVSISYDQAEQKSQREEPNI